MAKEARNLLSEAISFQTPSIKSSNRGLHPGNVLNAVSDAQNMFSAEETGSLLITCISRNAANATTSDETDLR